MVDKALEEIMGANIAKYREAAGLTQAALAEKIGISTAFVSRVERGQKKMKVETLYATTKALNVSVDAPIKYGQLCGAVGKHPSASCGSVG